MEAFPTCTEKAHEVAQLLLKEIIPGFGIPITMGSDNRLAFMAEVVQLLAKGLKMTCKLHSSYHPQSSGKVEWMNQTPKLQQSKLCKETQLQWDQQFLIALLRIRSSPARQTGFSHYEILYRCPHPIISGIWGDLKELGNITLRQQTQALGSTLTTTHHCVREQIPVILTTDIQPFKSGDAGWVK